MRTITTQTDVYKWDELSDTAKERAAQFINDEHFWCRESIDSLEAFAAHFGVKVTSWSYSPWGPVNIYTNATPAHFRGFTFSQACALPEYPTGYYMDSVLYNVFTKEFEHSGNAHAAFIEAMDAGIKEARADWEAQYDDYCMRDHCEANGYEFTINGAIYHEKQFDPFPQVSCRYGAPMGRHGDNPSNL